jgi:predicted SnoaL-like aldol condensation-catalyzing enzyme
LGRPKSGALIGFLAAVTGNTDLLKPVIQQKESDQTSTTESNKPNAMAFYGRMFSQCQRRAAIEKYTGDECIKHTPHVADGKEGVIEYFERLARDQPGKITHFKRAITEGILMIPHANNAYGAPEGGFALTRQISGS